MNPHDDINIITKCSPFILQLMCKSKYNFLTVKLDYFKIVIQINGAFHPITKEP